MTQWCENPEMMVYPHSGQIPSGTFVSISRLCVQVVLNVGAVTVELFSA